MEWWQLKIQDLLNAEYNQQNHQTGNCKTWEMTDQIAWPKMHDQVIFQAICEHYFCTAKRSN